MQILDNKKCRYFCIFAISLIYFLRIIYIDADVPAWGVSTYMPIDEGIYAELALNLLTFGSIDPNQYFQGQYEFLVSAQATINVFGNLVTYATLLLFGDNYFGLRMGTVIIGLILIWLVYGTVANVLKKIVADSPGVAYLIALCCAAILLISFPYFNASRIVDPCLSRMFFVALVLFVLSSERMKLSLKAFLIGFLTIASIFLVYVTNVFLGIPVLGLFVYLIATKKAKEAWCYLRWGIFGALCAYALSCVYYYCCWEISPLTNLLAVFGAFSSVDSAGYASSYQAAAGIGYLKNIRDFFVTNIVLYSFPLVAISVILLPLLFKKELLRRIGDIELFAVLTILGFLLQTVFFSDFVVKKQIVVLPAFLLLLAIEIERLLAKDQIKKGKEVIYVVIATLLCFAWLFYVDYFRLFKVNTTIMTVLDYSEFDILSIIVASICTIIAVLVFAIALLKKKHRIMIAGLLANCAIFAVLNIGFIYVHNYQDPSFTEKETMIAIGEKVGDGIVAGDYYPVYSLYNETKYLLNDRPIIASQLRENPNDLYYFDYSDAEHFSNDPRHLWQNVVTEETYPRKYSAYGQERSVSLYSSLYRIEG